MCEKQSGSPPADTSVTEGTGSACHVRYAQPLGQISPLVGFTCHHYCVDMVLPNSMGFYSSEPPLKGLLAHYHTCLSPFYHFPLILSPPLLMISLASPRYSSPKTVFYQQKVPKTVTSSPPFYSLFSLSLPLNSRCEPSDR